MALNALFVDFNSYFASVEQHLHPEWRGQPLAVVPLMAETTCCIAASYEAKAFGVKTGTGVAEARNLCHDIRFMDALNARFGKNAVYLGASHGALQAAPMRIAFTHIPDPEAGGDE